MVGDPLWGIIKNALENEKLVIGFVEADGEIIFDFYAFCIT
jgi:hypothetical protein